MKSLFRLLPLVCLLAVGLRCPAQPYDRYLIVEADADPQDSKWAEYLRGQLNRRSDQAGLLCETPDAHTLEVVVDLDSSMPEDYALIPSGNSLILRSKDDASMLWTLYQFLSWAASLDGRIQAADLPPALLDMRQAIAGTFPFRYRGIYSPTNNDPDFMAINATHNVDYDWGLWGHNLRKVTADTANENLYAWHDGKRDRRQFCFSSDQLFRSIEAYILENYGDGSRPRTSSRFCIMPDDNAIVCLCDKCRQAGNSKKNATPAVTQMLTRLAKRFPAHLFFTTSYLSTEEAPATRMPQNTGVIISAIDLPLSARPLDGNGPERLFAEKIRRWETVTDHIYVWDYMRNFDDYLTPFPILGILQNRLAFFQKIGVSGVFYNGSGYDYASFDDLQTFAIAAMLTTEMVDLQELIRNYLNHYYPESGELLCDYYWGLERRIALNGSSLDYYGGIEAAIKAYLNPQEFETFRVHLDALSKTVDGEERARLNKLLTALNFTALELMRTPLGTPYDTTKAEELIHNLKGHNAFPEMANYKESEGSIADYLNYWLQYGFRKETPSGMTRRIAAFHRSPERPGDLAPLSDCRYGFPNDYHTAWYTIDCEEIRTELQFDHACTVIIEGGFLYAPKWRMALPSLFSATRNGDECHKVSLDEIHPEPYSRVCPRVELAVSAGDSLRISIKPSGLPGSTTACDEIEIYEKK